MPDFSQMMSLERIRLSGLPTTNYLTYGHFAASMTSLREFYCSVTIIQPTGLENFLSLEKVEVTFSGAPVAPFQAPVTLPASLVSMKITQWRGTALSLTAPGLQELSLVSGSAASLSLPSTLQQLSMSYFI